METPESDLPGIAAGKVFPAATADTPRTYEGRLRRDFDGVIEKALSAERRNAPNRTDLLGAQVFANMRRARADIRAALERLDHFLATCLDNPVETDAKSEAEAHVALIRDRSEWL